MTNEQINIAIAEACGWTEIDGLSAKGLMGKPPEKLCSFAYLPNYCNDLNAMHEAERSLNSQQVQYYTLNLLRVTNNDGAKFHGTLGCFAHVRATAAQRAEAFLRTLGKWEGANCPVCTPEQKCWECADDTPLKEGAK
jgi:hypothetical protein